MTEGDDPLNVDGMGSVGVAGVTEQVMEAVQAPAPQNGLGRPSSGCLTLALAVVAFIATALAVFFGGKLSTESLQEACDAAAPRADGVVLISFAHACPSEEDSDATEDEETTTTTATTAPAEEGQRFAPPAPEDVPPGAQLFEGTSGTNIGYITCDGLSRFIHITNSTTAAGDAQRPAQEIVWPESGRIVDFGVNIPAPNRARYGFAIFTNGVDYINGCGMDVGQTSCRMDAEPKRVEQGDRVTIIVGEGGVLNPDGTPANPGEFVAEWWFVFQPD